jgi:formylglycine-generating enzyme required for sulfatase activity
MPVPKPIAPELVAIPGGSFQMGSDRHRPDERPRRWLSLAPFMASVTPVSNAEYERFVLATGAQRPDFASDDQFAGLAQPAVGISWHDAVAYCEWLNAELGGTFRLPTEAEREWASLGGLESVDWPWEGPIDRHPAFECIAGINRPHVPGAACENGYGLRCTAENVHEWCQDWYAKDAYVIAGACGPSHGTRRVARGGSWRHSNKFTRLTARASLDPTFRYNDFGFRVHADAPPRGR